MKKNKKTCMLFFTAMLLTGTFISCSQNDELMEYDLENNEVYTLAKRNMTRSGETIVPPQPPKEEEPTPRKIQLGNASYNETHFIPFRLECNEGYVNWETRPITFSGDVNLFWTEAYGVHPAQFEAVVTCDGENVECYVIEISRQKRDLVTVSFGFNVEYADASSVQAGVNIRIDPDFDFEHAFD